MALRALARSIPVTAAALAAICNACSLPAVVPRMSSDFASGVTRVRTVAVLPVDLSVTIADKDPESPETVFLDQSMLERVHRGLATALGRRGYEVTALVEPSGTSVDPRRGGWRLVIHPKDLAALRFEIHESTTPFAEGPGLIETRVSADLTRALRGATGADATVYARGWAYVAPEKHRGAEVAKVLVGVLLFLIVVGMIFAIFAGKGKTRSGPATPSRHHGHGAVHRAHFPGRVVLRTVSTLAAIAADLPPAPRCYRCPPPPPPPVGVDDGLDDPRIVPPASAPAPAGAAPPQRLYLRSGPPPEDDEVGLAISLVENQSGRVLWHAAQRFPVRAGPEVNVEALLDHFLKGLPPVR